MTKPTIGVDISKDHLDACRWPDGESLRVSNDAAGHRRLLRWIGEAALVAFEATGACHAAFVQLTGRTLADKTYVVNCDLSSCYDGDKRTIGLSLTAAF